MPTKPHFGPLKSQKPFLTFHQTGQAADANFYDGYDPGFLVSKARLLYAIYRNPDAFKACSNSWGMPAEETSDNLQSVVATELHNTSFHQTEAMIALLLCEYQNRPDWVYLTSYGNSEMKNAAKSIATGRFGDLTNGMASDPISFVKAAVYANVEFSSMPVAEQWERSVDDIAWLIGHAAERFVSGQEYNAYKHGLRVVAGSAGLGVATQTGPSEFKRVLSMKHAVTYLELGEETGGYVGQCVTKEVSPEYSFELINCIALVLMTTKEMRVARTKQHVDTASFPQIDREVLLKLQPQSSFSLPY
jgi:hypothetical protein